MKPIDFEGSNMTFGAPAGMTEDEVKPLKAQSGNDELGAYVQTVWKPSEQDIAAFVAGRSLVVKVMGHGLPPMSLFTVDENDNINDQDWD